jgi:transposase
LNIQLITLWKTESIPVILTQDIKKEDTGMPAYSLKVLLKIVLLAYSSGIISSRKIARACDENIIFMADTGSLCEENLKYLSQKKVDACISDQLFRKRDPIFNGCVIV